MRNLLVLAALLVASCGSPGAGPRPAGGQDALSRDLFPFDAAPAAFIDVKDSMPRTVRVEPSPEGDWARFVLDVPGGEMRQMRVSRMGDSLWFSSGPGAGTEIVRAGAVPGDTWESDGRRLAFEQWEDVTVPAGRFHAARVSVRRGPAGLEQTETWWFARGVGLVRLKSDHGSVWTDELVRTTP